MSSFEPPADKIWWKVPVGREEVLWVGIALVWCLIMFFMMPFWHIYGKQNLSSEAYTVEASQFKAKVDEMVAQYKVGEENGIPIVSPPAGSDVFMLGRLWQWYPILKLKKDETYRMHLSSLDWQHGFSVQPVNINLQVVPGYDMVFNLTPDKAGDYGVICNEYCGIGHHMMTGKIIIEE